MRINIEEVVDATRGRVRFRSGGDSVDGHWGGPGEIPVGRDLDIEMEVSAEEIISVRPAFRSSRDPVEQDGGVVVIVGCVERVGVDGVIEFRAGDDLILLEQCGPLADVAEGAYIELRVPDLKIYPIDL